MSTMKSTELDIKNKILVTLSSESSFICDKIITNKNSEINTSFSKPYKVDIINFRLFSNFIDLKDVNLGVIKNIVSPLNYKLLVTIVFNNKYLEFVCDEIGINTGSFGGKSFSLIGYDIQNIIIKNPLTNDLIDEIKKTFYEPKDYINYTDAIIKTNSDKDEIKKKIEYYFIQKVVNIACAQSYVMYTPDSEESYKRTTFFNCYIHSVEVFKKYITRKWNSTDNLELMRIQNKRIFTCYNKWQENELEIEYLFEEKQVILRGRYDESYSYFTWDEGSRDRLSTYYITLTKKFDSRSEMNIYIDYFENILKKEKVIFLADKMIISNYKTAMAIFKEDFEFEEEYETYTS